MRSWIRRLALIFDPRAAGLAMVGAYWVMPISGSGMNNADAYREKDSLNVAGPPPGHPERLIADQPLSLAERKLWASLTELDR